MIMDNTHAEPVAFKGSREKTIYGTLYWSGKHKSVENVPVTLFLHGFKGFKDWGAFPQACRYLAYSEQPSVVLSLNFSHNGIDGNGTDFNDLEAFSQGTLSDDLEDIGHVIRQLKERKKKFREELGLSLDGKAISLIGHSRGGHTAITAAAEYPEVKCVITWSAVADYKHHVQESMIADWENDGVTYIPNSRTGQQMPLNSSFWDDIKGNGNRVRAVKRLEEVYIPACFIHAEEDEAVPLSNMNLLYENCASTHKVKVSVPNAGHTFGVQHPWNGNTLPEPFMHVLENTDRWLNKILAE